VACYENVPAKRIVVGTLAGFAIVTGLYWLMADVLLIRMPSGLLF
jgi:putative tricarboxylic transport membrane protein